MGRRGFRVAAALALAWMLALLPAAPALAERSVYFTAVDEKVLPVTEETMPFWSNGHLYIASGIFTDAVFGGTARSALGITCVENRSLGVVALTSGGSALVFDIAGGFARDDDGDFYYPGAVLRDGASFIPASVVADFFGLQYSTTQVEHGQLVWLRHSDFRLQMNAFAAAAARQLQDSYREYLADLEPEEPSPPETLPEEPGEPVEPVEPEEPKPSGPAVPQTPGRTETPSGQTETPASQTRPPEAGPEEPDEPEEPEEPLIRGEQDLYLCLRAGTNTESLLDALDSRGIRAAFFCGARFLEEEGDLLRRMTAAGHSIGLLAQAGVQPDDLDDLNRLLERAVCRKTRLVLIDGGGAAVREAARQAGYLCFQPDLTPSALRTAAQAQALILQADGGAAPASVWLENGATGAGLAAFLTAAAAVRDRILPLTELSVP